MQKWALWYFNQRRLRSAYVSFSLVEVFALICVIARAPKSWKILRNCKRLESETFEGSASLTDIGAEEMETDSIISASGMTETASRILDKQRFIYGWHMVYLTYMWREDDSEE